MKYPDEPISHWTLTDFDNFLTWCTHEGASDIIFQPGTPIWNRNDGAWKIVSNRIFSSDEIASLLDQVTKNASSSAQLMGGEDLDFSYEIRISRFNKIRFRVNASACRDGWKSGSSLTLRTIPSLPPTVEELNVEQELLNSAFPQNGLVLVTGVMGTGKSTLLAAIIRKIRATQPRSILTYESPIEFDLMGIPNAKGPLVQTEIPRHLKGFDLIARNAARRAADILLVGESRDRETLRGMIEAAEIGVCAYSTVHTRSVAETPSRIISVFPDDMQNQIAATLISSLRMVIQQRLLPKVGGGREPIKEWLNFDNSLRTKLFKTPISELIPTIEKMVKDHGHSLLDDVQLKYNNGLIFKEDLEVIQREKEAA